MSRLRLQIATVPLDFTTSGNGPRIVEVGVYPVRLTLSDGRVITPIHVPATVDIHGVAITFDFRGSTLLMGIPAKLNAYSERKPNGIPG